MPTTVAWIVSLIFSKSPAYEMFTQRKNLALDRVKGGLLRRELPSWSISQIVFSKRSTSIQLFSFLLLMNWTSSGKWDWPVRWRRERNLKSSKSSRPSIWEAMFMMTSNPDWRSWTTLSAEVSPREAAQNLSGLSLQHLDWRSSERMTMWLNLMPKRCWI